MFVSLRVWRASALAVAIGLASLPALAQSGSGRGSGGRASSAAPVEPRAPAGKAADQPKASMGGYSWSDKHPHRHRHRHRRRVRFHFDPDAPIATFPGFRMLPDGRSVVWVSISRKVAVQVHQAAGHVAYVLPGVQVSIRNNTNALVTTYFDTPLSRARLVRSKKGTVLVLELREKLKPSYRVVDGPRGTMMLEVTLPRPAKSFHPPNATPVRGKKPGLWAPVVAPPVPGGPQVPSRPGPKL